MHYYSFNIADYRKDTTHLTAIEHYIYRSLIDWYYLDEQPIPKETQSVLRRLGLGSDGLPLLQNVLSDFFYESDEGFKHERIEEEIAKYRLKAETARVNGTKGGRPKKPKKTQSVKNRNSRKTGSKANQEPITNNQCIGGFTPPTQNEVMNYCDERGNNIDAQRFCDFYQSKGWMVGKNKMKDWKAAVRQWESRDQSRSVEADPFAGGI